MDEEKNSKKIKEKVVIIGLGRIGSVFFDILKRNRNIEVLAYDRKLKNFDLKSVLKDANYIFLCIPSYEIRKFILKNKKHISSQSLFVLLSKGLEGKTFKFPFEVVKEVLPQNYYVIFGGPLMAEEISQGKGGVALVASTFPNFLKIKRIFGDCGIYFKHSSDFKGVSLAGVLKNIYTLFLEVSCEANLGLNLKGYFIAKILNEMEKICKLLNCNVRSIRYEAGLGDLIATSFSPYSRNRKFVQNLINNKKLNFKAEGFVSLKNILKIKEIKQNIKFLPILKSTYDLLVLKKEKYKVLENLWQKIK